MLPGTSGTRWRVLIEHWFAPGILDPARVVHNTGDANGVRVSRVGRVEVDGRLSRIYFDYGITDRTGTREVGEFHELSIFTQVELLEAFRRSGLAAEFDPEGLTDRGLYIARCAAA